MIHSVPIILSQTTHQHDALLMTNQKSNNKHMTAVGSPQRLEEHEVDHLQNILQMENYLMRIFYMGLLMHACSYYA